MTEKRFTLKYINEQHISANLYDDKTFIGSIGIGAELIVELLNDLSEENDVLKQQLKTKVIVNKQYEELQRIKQENEQLKSTIKKVTELLSDEVDLFSEKTTEHDIIAYEELKELDNKDAYYMATATKKAIKILKRCFND